MAIDTAEKRKNIISINYFISITNNVSKDIDWRQQAGYGYGGISALSRGLSKTITGASGQAYAVTGASGQAYAVTGTSKQTISITGVSTL